VTELPGSTDRCFRLLAPNIYDAIYRDWTADSVNAYVIYQEIPGQNIVPVEHCQHVSGGASTKDSVPLIWSVRYEEKLRTNSAAVSLWSSETDTMSRQQGKGVPMQCQHSPPGARCWSWSSGSLNNYSAARWINPVAGQWQDATDQTRGDADRIYMMESRRIWQTVCVLGTVSPRLCGICWSGGTGYGGGGARASTAADD
jgi:hypothetical protein